MRSRLGLALCVVGSLAAGTGCSKVLCSQPMYEATSASPPNASGGGVAKTDGSAAVAEADIVEVDGKNLYAMSRSGTLSIVDVSNPGKLLLEGSTKLPGIPFEMYRRGDVLFAMSTQAVNADGSIRPVAANDAAASSSVPAPGVGTDLGSVVTALDVSDPAAIKTIASFPVSGEIADSRVIGGVLYLATYEDGNGCWQCGQKARTLVTSFDVSEPRAIHRVDSLAFDGAATGSTAGWGMAWRRSIFANDQRIYVGGIAATQASSRAEGQIEVIDVSDRSGHMKRSATIATKGPVLSRWQMDETGGVFRVVSQAGVGWSSNGQGMPEVQTFTVDGETAFAPLGRTSIQLPRQEGLRTVRFDGPRAYAITFNQTDPLFVIDLADPAKPAQKGQLEMPGWMFHLEPHGDRVIGLGVDRTDPNGALNVSLFDVADASNPKLLQRVAFGANLGEDFMILDYQVPEDQDRIQKAFKVLEDGLVVVPFSNGTSTCTTGKGGGIELIDWKQDSLVARGALRMSGNPRRAFEANGHLVGVSDSNVSAFAISKSAPLPAQPASDLVIGQCTTKAGQYGGGMWGEGGDVMMGDGVENRSCLFR